MTLPMERINSLRKTQRFLFDLLDRSKIKGVPSEVRKRASECLKHYPMEVDIQEWEVDAKREEATMFGEHLPDHIAASNILMRLDKAIEDASSPRAKMHEPVSEPLEQLLRDAQDEIIKLGVMAYLIKNSDAHD